MNENDISLRGEDFLFIIVLQQFSDNIHHSNMISLTYNYFLFNFVLYQLCFYFYYYREIKFE